VAGRLTGNVIAIDDNGNILTDIGEGQLRDVPRDERVVIDCEGHTTFGIFPVDHGQPEMTFLAVLNPQHQLMLTMVGESAQAFLGIRAGSRVELSWT
jgi:S-adenosylmethionine hydrolase